MFQFWYRYRMRRQMRAQSAVQRGGGILRTLTTPLRWLWALPSAALRSVGFSLSDWVAHLAGQRRMIRDLLLGMPAIVLFVAFTILTAVGHVTQARSSQEYWIKGEKKLRDGDPKTAQIFLQKAMLGENVNERDILFALARSYEATEDLDRADLLMRGLATPGAEGYPAAHRYLAIRAAFKVSRTQQVEDLEGWHWHLSHADQPNSPAIQKSWGTYYLIAGDLPKSAEHFRIAAETEPSLWLQVAEIEARMNDVEAVRRTLALARERLERQFFRDPGNTENRLFYATSLFYLGQLPDAERLLKEGLQQEDNQSFRQLLAAVFVRMYDAELAGAEGVDSAFRFLQLALDYEPNFTPALTRLVTFARADEANLDKSREAMRRLISSGNASAMAHFTLGTLEWLDGNQELALLNMRQSIELNPNMPVIANNVAYLMAQEESPDLETALNLVNQSIESDPKNSDYLDTRGEIYLKMGSLSKAAVDFQLALESARNPIPLQQKLADLYEAMGDPAMAAQFRKAASQRNVSPEE